MPARRSTAQRARAPKLARESAAAKQATPALSDFSRAVVRVVRRVPRGRVTSYAVIAALVGKPRAARAVGSALRALPDDVEIPWWRVVNGRGTISPGGNIHRDRLQRALLEAEDVRFSGAGRIDLVRYGWKLPREVD